MPAAPLRLGLAGLGTVGIGVVRIVQAEAELVVLDGEEVATDIDIMRSHAGPGQASVGKIHGKH